MAKWDKVIRKLIRSGKIHSSFTLIPPLLVCEQIISAKVSRWVWKHALASHPRPSSHRRRSHWQHSDSLINTPGLSPELDSYCFTTVVHLDEVEFGFSFFFLFFFPRHQQWVTLLCNTSVCCHPLAHYSTGLSRIYRINICWNIGVTDGTTAPTNHRKHDKKFSK